MEAKLPTRPTNSRSTKSRSRRSCFNPLGMEARLPTGGRRLQGSRRGRDAVSILLEWRQDFRHSWTTEALTVSGSARFNPLGMEARLPTFLVIGDCADRPAKVSILLEWRQDFRLIVLDQYLPWSGMPGFNPLGMEARLPTVPEGEVNTGAKGSCCGRCRPLVVARRRHFCRPWC